MSMSDVDPIAIKFLKCLEKVFRPTAVVSEEGFDPAPVDGSII